MCSLVKHTKKATFTVVGDISLGLLLRNVDQVIGSYVFS